MITLSSSPPLFYRLLGRPLWEWPLPAAHTGKIKSDLAMSHSHATATRPCPRNDSYSMSKALPPSRLNTPSISQRMIARSRLFYYQPPGSHLYPAKKLPFGFPVNHVLHAAHDHQTPALATRIVKWIFPKQFDSPKNRNASFHCSLVRACLPSVLSSLTLILRIEAAMEIEALSSLVHQTASGSLKDSL